MLGALASRESWMYKSVFDGADFARSKVGKEFLNWLMLEYINEHCTLKGELDLEAFVYSCVQVRKCNEPTHKLPIKLRDKYEIGLFVTSPGNCFNSNYILFNQEQLEFWDGGGISTWDIPFLVCPSRDREGHINEIGFRVLDTARVLNAFKWLFLRGGQATYGLQNLAGRSAVLVEGCFDQIAFAESGVPNVVGLGSVFFNEGHRLYLGDLDQTFCLDQDRFGIAQRKEHTKYCFFAPEAKDPFDAWSSSGYVKLVCLE